jgi:2-C-methyl-D-erythritol 4-phosphate cytidylyltransferase
VIDAPICAVGRNEVSALILAAGSGTRLGRSKAFLEYEGKTLLERAVEQAAMFADEVLVGLGREDLGRVPSSVGCRPVTLLAGGETRHATVEALLDQATRPLVLLHEVARPLAPPSLFAAVLEAAQAFGAAAPCLLASTRDSLVTEEGGFVAAALPRDRVVRLQTPQAYRRDWLADVFRQAHAQALQETSSVPPLLLRAGYRVRLVPGSPDNLKITFPEDWDRVRSILALGGRSGDAARRPR